jgi:hypothetical protein
MYPLLTSIPEGNTALEEPWIKPALILVLVVQMATHSPT